MYSKFKNFKNLFLCLIFIIVFNQSTSLATEEKSWKLIGPGDADQVSSLNVMKDGTVFLGTDIGGIYRSINQGDWWEPMNKGLKNYDITTQVIQDPINPQMLYVGTRGGFYKSTNGGISWRNIRGGLPKVSQYSLSSIIGSIAIDPFDNNILYLGLGYRPSSEGTDVVKKYQWIKTIYKSTDKGESWNESGSFGNSVKVYQIVQSAFIPNLIYVATNDGIYRSVNSGGRWERIFEKETLNILLIPNVPKEILAACGSQGVYITKDDGMTWAATSRGLEFRNHPSGPDRYSILVLDPSNKNIIYLLNSTWGIYGGGYKSLDGGKSWKGITKKLPESWLETSRRMNAITIDINSPQKIYLGSSRYVYRSDNGGEKWTQLISKRVNNGWSHQGINVFGHTRVVAGDPNNKKIIYIGTTDHGMVKSDDGGFSWLPSTTGMKYRDSVWDIAMCGNNPNYLYAISLSSGQKFCISKSENRAKTWKPIYNGLEENYPFYKIVIDPNNCQKIFVCGEKGVFISSDGGETWSSIGRNLPSSKVICLALDPSNPSLLYAGMREGLYRSVGAGSNWENLTTHMKVNVTSVLISKKDPRVLFIGTEQSGGSQGGIFKSIDGGKTWSNVLGAYKLVSGIVQLDSDPDILYAATNDDNFHDESCGSGVFYSRDHGNNWYPVNNGLSVLRAFNINCDSWGRIFLSSNGSGAYLLIDPNIK